MWHQHNNNKNIFSFFLFKKRSNRQKLTTMKFHRDALLCRRTLLTLLISMIQIILTVDAQFGRRSKVVVTNEDRFPSPRVVILVRTFIRSQFDREICAFAMFTFFLVYLGTTRAFYIECHPLGYKPNLTKLTPTLLGLQYLVEWYICTGIIFTKMCICQIKFSAWFESLISLKVQPRVWPYKANFLHKLCYAGFKHHDFLKIFIG